MKLGYFVQMGVVAVAALGLVACSSGKKSGMNYSGPDGASAGASAYGAQSDTGYDASSGMHVNSLTAPSNQVYYFDFNQDGIRSQDYKAMGIQAAYLAAHPNAKIRLEGNTDNRGSREYNVALGWRRDQTVARYFEQQGVSASQIQMLSYGKERPVAMGNDEHAWALNRRVNLIYKAY